MLPFYLAIFLLFFAVLAAGYFYLQRAKARDAATAEASASASGGQASVPAEAPAAESAAATTASEGTDTPAS